MRNPLSKRLPRELKSEFGKYLVIFILLTATIGFVSGFLVSDGSLIAAYNEGFEKYNIEDGNFRLSEKANKAQVKYIQEEGAVTLYDNFYAEEALTNGSTLRIYQNRDVVNTVCLMEGAFPEATDEVAIDRMYADNNGLRVGDMLENTAGRQWTVTGLVALPDYSCLFADNNDSMFDSVKFGVAVVTPEAFLQYREKQLHFDYSWIYDEKPADEMEEKEQAEDLMKLISSETKLETFVPQYQNQAITFTGEDMGGDRAMVIALLYMVIAIMAFVFGITMANTIAREANVIGTLRASGYTKGELIRHYLAMPVAVTLIGAVIGNIGGYTVMKNVCAGMYYGSYSLPVYVTRWNAQAFLLTTVVPVLLMVVINICVLADKLSLPPLNFLRRDLRRRKQRRALYLSKYIPFLGRFRIRVIFQNMSNYLILLVGILFANLLLMFGLLFPAVLAHYQETIPDQMLCSYQYILQVPLDAMNEDRKLESLFSMMLFQREVETDNEDAEKFSAYSLKTVDGKYKSEEILLYGVQEDSRYVPLSLGTEDVYLSSAYADKFLIQPGDTIRLKEAYEDTTYEFTVTGIYDYDGGMAVFMNQDRLNEVFDLGSDYFSGYFSDTEITDIDEAYIGSVIDLDAMTKISRQLTVSMGGMMTLIDGFAVGIFFVLIYLLSKIIIEKNAQSISMTKILGYTGGEIAGLYIIPTSIMTVLFLVLSLPIEYEIMVWLFREVMLQSMSGWIPLYIDPMVYVKMLALGLLAYGVVAATELRKIRKIPMNEALKNAE